MHDEAPRAVREIGKVALARIDVIEHLQAGAGLGQGLGRLPAATTVPQRLQIVGLVPLLDEML
eukprot:gene491-7760_t